MKSAILCGMFVVVVLVGTAIATSEPVCMYEPAHKFLRKGESYLPDRGDGWCSKKVTCQPDYTLLEEECDKRLCPADKLLSKNEYPDCCCG